MTIRITTSDSAGSGNFADPIAAAVALLRLADPHALHEFRMKILPALLREVAAAKGAEIKLDAPVLPSGPRPFRKELVKV